MSNQVALLAIIVASLSLSSCGASEQAARTYSEPQVAPATDATLPTLTADEEHQHIGGSKHLIYNLTGTKGFVFRVPSGFLKGVSQAPKNAEPMMEVILDKQHISRYRLPAGQTEFAIKPPGGFQPGQEFVVGIGSETTTGSKVDFYPEWVGMVKVEGAK